MKHFVLPYNIEIMPRTTRAALRNAVLEDPVDAANVPLPAMPTRGGRAPLGEISNNTVQEEPKILLEVNLGKPAKDEKEKKKKIAKVVKAGKSVPKRNEKKQSEVVEDDCQSSASSAVAEACQQLSRHCSEGARHFHQLRIW